MSKISDGLARKHCKVRQGLFKVPIKSFGFRFTFEVQFFFVGFGSFSVIFVVEGPAPPPRNARKGTRKPTKRSLTLNRKGTLNKAWALHSLPTKNSTNPSICGIMLRA